MKRGRDEIGPGPDGTAKYRRVVPKPDAEFDGDMAAADSYSVRQPSHAAPSSSLPFNTLPQLPYGSPRQQGTANPVMTPMGVMSPGQSPKPQMRMGPQSYTPQVQQPEKFNRALDFLEQVKLQFHSKPHVYNMFLEIMKEFKAKVIDTPGVIGRVSELFVGHPHLIKGFNNFLPPGHKIDSMQQDGEVPPPTVQQMEMRQEDVQPVQMHANAIAQPASMQSVQHVDVGVYGGAAATQNPRTEEELVHAREYVNKIKERFADRPESYKSFLQILSDFKSKTEKECTSSDINEVYTQVATLFQTEPDLLGEFTQFLPPAATAHMPEMPMPRPQKKSTRKKRSKREGRQKKVDDPRQDDEDFDFFLKIKHQLRNDHLYSEFLKCLEMLANGIIGQDDLLNLLGDLFEGYPHVLDDFRDFAGFKESVATEDFLIDDSQAAAWLDIDFGACRRCGPSYRELPPEHRKLSTSGRTPLSKSVLNDIWVSVPTGSEDGGSFKASRKNQYEEVLFKCEDDRYELDMLIEQNASTIHALEIIMDKIQNLDDQHVPDYRLSDDAIPTLSLRSIQRVYGEKSGGDIIDGLRNNPIVAVPIVLRRLHQKDLEWRKARKEWSKIWSEITEKNHHKSLDHQSANFKQNEKKLLSSKALIAEIKQKYQSKLKSKSPLGYHLKYQIRSDDIIKDIFTLVAIQSQISVSAQDRPKLNAFISLYFRKFLAGEAAQKGYKTSDLGQGEKEGSASPSDSTVAEDASQESSTQSGDRMDVAADAPPAANSSTNGDAVDAAATAAASTAAPDTNGTTEVAAPEAASESLVLFGNNTIYVLFRLFQILYDRLENARVQADQLVIRNRPTEMQTMLNFQRKSRNSLPSFQNGQEMYEHFFTEVLQPFVRGEMDQQAFEDVSREMYGVNSFTLFTLDKVVAQLTKQFMSVLSCDVCAKLIALSAASPTRTEEEAVAYRQLARNVLREDRMFKFEFVKSDHGKLCIELLDAVHQPRFVELSLGKSRMNQYVQEYTAPSKTPDPPSAPATPTPRARQVFLQRNRPHTGPSMENVVTSNRLRCKICLSTYRLFFVENTEDCFYRSGALQKAKAASGSKKRLQRFVEWADGKVKEGE